jgi:uncharacterized protein YbgA (DUF1722 family)
LYTNTRFREARETGEMKTLVKFHTQHKYLFMAYNQAAYRDGGRIVANHEKLPVNKVFENYENNLVRIMAKAAKPAAIINAVHHLFGGFSKNLSKDEKQFFLNTVEEYRDERIPLTTVIHLLQSYAIRFDVKFVKDQVFMNPFPDELVNLSNSAKRR